MEATEPTVTLTGADPACLARTRRCWRTGCPVSFQTRLEHHGARRRQNKYGLEWRLEPARNGVVAACLPGVNGFCSFGLLEASPAYLSSSTQICCETRPVRGRLTGEVVACGHV